MFRFVACGDKKWLCPMSQLAPRGASSSLSHAPQNNLKISASALLLTAVHQTHAAIHTAVAKKYINSSKKETKTSKLHVITANLTQFYTLKSSTRSFIRSRIKTTRTLYGAVDQPNIESSFNSTICRKRLGWDTCLLYTWPANIYQDFMIDVFGTLNRQILSNQSVITDWNQQFILILCGYFSWSPQNSKTMYEMGLQIRIFVTVCSICWRLW